MEITVSARHIDISPALRAAAEEKIGRLSRFLDGMDRAEVHFSEERNPRIAAKEVCEVTSRAGATTCAARRPPPTRSRPSTSPSRSSSTSSTSSRRSSCRARHGRGAPEPAVAIASTTDDDELVDQR